MSLRNIPVPAGQSVSPQDAALSNLAVTLLRLQGLLPRQMARRGIAAIRSGAPVVILDPLDQLLSLTQQQNPMIDAFVGEYLLGPGKHPELGLECLKMAALTSNIDDYVGLMARMELRNHNIDPFHPGIPSTQPTTQPATQPVN